MKPMSPLVRIVLVVFGLLSAVTFFTGDRGFKTAYESLFARTGKLEAVEYKAGPADQLDLVTASGSHRFTVELADTDAKRSEGLMFRKSMAADHGMLFDFKREQQANFWMKNTYIPLDMIFINAQGTVASIGHDTVPLSEAEVPSGVPVRFVLEVNAGVANKIGLKPGDRVVHVLVRPEGG